MKYEEKFITVNKKRLYCRFINRAYEDKQKPFLVFLHEGLGSTAQWRTFPEELSKTLGYPAIAYDRYGYGGSEAKTEKCHAGYMHDEAFIYLPALLEKAGIDSKVILIGHSDGGTIALLYAAMYPQKTLGIITEAAHVFCEKVTTAGVKEISKKYRQQNLKEKLAVYHGDKAEVLFESWTGFWLSEEATRWDITDFLPRITVPVFAIQGTDDNYGSVRQLTTILEKCGSTTLINHLSDCGHAPHSQQSEKVTAMMSAFIKILLNRN